MRKRVALAQTLVTKPKILLMDEPFSALDAQTREVMQVELLRIWQQGRKTVLFITHQIDEAVFLADRIVVLGRRPGRVKETIPIELPRPRALSIKRTAEFGAYVERVWNLIEKDVHDSVQEQAELATSPAS
jgi:NitT/TauT family transport system ATP-binding protein